MEIKYKRTRKITEMSLGNPYDYSSKNYSPYDGDFYSISYGNLPIKAKFEDYFVETDNLRKHNKYKSGSLKSIIRTIDIKTNTEKIGIVDLEIFIYQKIHSTYYVDVEKTVKYFRSFLKSKGLLLERSDIIPCTSLSNKVCDENDVYLYHITNYIEEVSLKLTSRQRKLLKLTLF